MHKRMHKQGRPDWPAADAGEPPVRGLVAQPLRAAPSGRSSSTETRTCACYSSLFVKSD